MLLLCNLSFGQIDSIIYGISSFYPDTGVYLSKIDPNTGIVTQISSNQLDFPHGYNGRSIDPVNQIFYYSLDSVFLKFSLQSGELIEAIPFIGLGTSKFFGFEYDCSDSTVYGLYYNSTTHSVQLATVDQYTGIIGIISNSSIASSFRSQTFTTIDPFRKVFYFETTDNYLIGVNLSSGEIETNVLINAPNGHSFGPLVFNCYDSLLYGMVGNITIGRKLAIIDPSTGIITNISQDTVMNAIQINPATIDPFRQIYYITAAGNVLKGFDLKSGETVVNSIISTFADEFFINLCYNHSCYMENPVSIDKLNQYCVYIFPNPADGKITLRSSGKKFSNIKLIDMLGRTIKKSINNRNLQVSLDVSKLNNGIYNLSIQIDEIIINKKIIINHNH